MKSLMLPHVQTLVLTPSKSVRSLVYAQMPRRGFFSSLAHWISQFCPLDEREFLLTSAITPSDRRIRVFARSFQAVSYDSFTDISTYSNGDLVCSDWPFRKSRCRSSSIANATKIVFLSAIQVLPLLHSKSRIAPAGWLGT